VSSGSGDRSVATLSLTPTRSGSLVFGVGNDPDRPSARSLPSGQSIVHQWVDRDANSTFWVQTVTDPVLANNTMTVGNTAPSRDPWNMVAVEIVPR
jgi:hypothetical protein